jgi:hypothetical protein
VLNQPQQVYKSFVFISNVILYVFSVYLLLEDVLNRFFSGSFEREGDALKMALMSFANNIL